MADEIKFSQDQQDLLSQKLQKYCAESLDYDLGRFDAQFLLDFITAEIGIYYYNQGVFDAQAVLSKKIDDIQDLISQLERFPKMKK